MNETRTTTGIEDLDRLFSIVREMEREGRSFEDMINVLFLRNITIEGVESFLKYHLYSFGVRPEISYGAYGTMVQDVLAEDGLVQRTDPELIVLSLALEELDPAYGTVGWRAHAVQAELESLFEVLATQTRATIVVNTFIAPLYPELGIALDPDVSDATSQVALLNRFIVDFVRRRTPRFCVVDWDRYIRLLGTKAAIDDRCRYLWKAPFKKAFLNLYAEELARIVRALKGKAKKCLILDCDNTLWGGVIGEDGVDGIKLDGNSYPGKAFHDFQRNVLHLAERGVLIVLCSKNNEADVFEVLDNHPWCPIKRSHLAGWRINWQDKAANIVELADELNLGLDSFVLVDDNAAECELVRGLLPQVTVAQVPEKLHELPSLVLEQGWFDTLRVTDEDKHRAQLYQGESERKNARATFSSVDEYLASLSIVAVIHRVRSNEIARVAQLTQKTNQFNLTTRRYSEADVQAFANREDAVVLTLATRDRFGDLGLVGVLILERDGGVGRVDTFLMSCRVLGRGLEHAMVERCFETMRAAWGVETWRAEYIATRKNMQVADFWPLHGFVQTSGDRKSTVYQRAARAPAIAIPTHIAIRED
jgi:FkbH-like protein